MPNAERIFDRKPYPEEARPEVERYKRVGVARPEVERYGYAGTPGCISIPGGTQAPLPQTVDKDDRPFSVRDLQHMKKVVNIA